MDPESGQKKVDSSKHKPLTLSRILSILGYNSSLKWIIGILIFIIIYFFTKSKSGGVSSIFGASGVCVFDTSSLINPTDYSKYSYAEESIQACLDNNMEIGVISSNEQTVYNYERKFLSYYFPNVLTESRMNSMAFQIHPGMDLTRSLRLITASFGMGANCGVLISTRIQNEMDTEKIGMGFVDVKVRDGVIKSDIDVAIVYLQDNCGAGGIAPVHPCSDVPPDSSYTCARQKKWGKCEEAWMKDFCCYSCHNCMCGLYSPEPTAPGGGSIDKSVPDMGIPSAAGGNSNVDPITGEKM